MKRMTEHKLAVRRGDTNNGIAVHAWDAHNTMLTGKVQRSERPHLWKRRVLEAIHIQTQRNNNNLDSGLQISHILWHPFIK